MSVVLLLDKSGSMGGPEGGWERMLLAKETLHSLLLTFRHAEDRVRIMGYDTGSWPEINVDFLAADMNEDEVVNVVDILLLIEALDLD